MSSDTRTCRPVLTSGNGSNHAVILCWGEYLWPLVVIRFTDYPSNNRLNFAFLTHTYSTAIPHEECRYSTTHQSCTVERTPVLPRACRRSSAGRIPSWGRSNHA